MTRFELNPIEEANFKKWLKEHNETCRCFNPTPEDRKRMDEFGGYPFGIGMTGRPLTWIFVQDSIGYSVHIKCSCGEEADLTDNDKF